MDQLVERTNEPCMAGCIRMHVACIGVQIEGVQGCMHKRSSCTMQNVMCCVIFMDAMHRSEHHGGVTYRAIWHTRVFVQFGQCMTMHNIVQVCQAVHAMHVMRRMP